MENSHYSPIVLVSALAKAKIFKEAWLTWFSLPLFLSWADKSMVPQIYPCEGGKRKPKRLGCAIDWETSHLQNPGLGASDPPRAPRGSSSQVSPFLSPGTWGYLFTRGQVRCGWLEYQLSFSILGSHAMTGMEKSPDDSYRSGYSSDPLVKKWR